MVRPDPASAAQIAAADPSGSVWLAANAGSGKTRVLTDRVAWLLLEGTSPERILCLTYTKAAAGEMQNRLFKRLSGWAMLPDDELRAAITKLGAARGTISPERLRHARTLFARAIETPGGLKIQTIHAFCASLLRRFPLEAGVSPNFAEMDEIAAARLHAEVFDAMAADPETQPLVDGIARRLSDTEPAAFLAAVARLGSRFAAMPVEALRPALGIADLCAEDILAEIAGPSTRELMVDFLDGARTAPGKSLAGIVEVFDSALDSASRDRFELLRGACLTGTGAPRSTGKWPKAVKEGEHGELVEIYCELAARIADGVARIAALEALTQTEALHAFAPAFIARVAAEKAARGWLDFDDQIARARHLLSTSSMAQWVLFKLDGGIDHILVDEAQDTSPDQWEVITRLAAEFGAGQGARPDAHRTIFVVGDRKQSIYAFQGADLDAYGRIRSTFADMHPPGGVPFKDHALLFSFRSSPVILDLVDAVFAEGGGLGEAPRHIAFHPDMPGRVDLWPVIPKQTEDRADREWFEPIDRPAPNDAEVVLAERVAEGIATMIAERVPVGRGAARRPVEAGDILVLVQRRNTLFHHLIRACKRRDLDLAGADRLVVTEDLAVRDLIALLKWVALPEDDLSLATVLRSPLGNLDEAGLFTLAHGREGGRLWPRLRATGIDREAETMLSDLLGASGYERPYELLQRILIRHDGRRRLLARLGTERAEAIDALLRQALDYEQLEVPSLTGFLCWIEAAAVELKRQGGQGSIRVMTVHGAKGLEAPVVILPETATRKARTLSGVERLPGGVPVWMPVKANWSPAMHEANERAVAATRAERDRLLYVALTRAESWLIVAAAGEVGETPEASWFRAVEAGMTARGAEAHDFACGRGLRLEQGDWSAAEALPIHAPVRAETPDWLGRAAPKPERAIGRIAPSQLPGAKALPGESGLDTERAMRLGTAVHALLEHLPGLPAAERRARAPAILAAHADLPPGFDPEAQIDEALAVLDAPELASVFAPGTLAEVPFALPATATRPAIVGTMDRLLVAPDRVTVVDFKTNATLPATPERIPEGLLRQLAAYGEAAATIWPGRAVTLAILWTKGPALMEVPEAVIAALPPAIDPVGPGT
nr:double-strand break repair helicase AddA [uncultured Jannaschia sp.]